MNFVGNEDREQQKEKEVNTAMECQRFLFSSVLVIYTMSLKHKEENVLQ
jgi:hypothetical protein